MAKFKTQIGFLLLGLSIFSWGMVFGLPLVITEDLGWWMSGAYGLSYVLWFSGIAILGKPAVEKAWNKLKIRWKKPNP